MAECVALALQLLFQRPLRCRGQVDLQHRSGGAQRRAEHVVLAGLTVAQVLFGGLDRSGQLQHQAGAGGRQRVECAGQDQCFEHAAIELGRIDAAAEVGQVGVGAMSPFGHDRLARALTDALDRAQAVLDHLRLHRHEHVLRGVDVRRLHGDAERA